MTYRQPDPPTLSDKLADWQVLADGGGDALFVGKDVVDVGPLFGLEGLLYAGRAKTYVALDCSEAILLRQAPLVERRCADITKAPWPFADASVDTVLDLSTFDDTAEPMVCYAEAARVLRPGGHLITAFANATVVPPTPEWTSQDPYHLAVTLEGMGFGNMRGWRFDQARAHVIAERL